MVKYKFIKEGAYSVKVEDVEAVNNFNAKAEKEKQYDSDGDEIDDDDDDNDLLFQYNLDDNEPVELEEDIDYTDTSFILQNLKIGIPSVNDDKTYTLQSREIQANIISSQIRFYLYCCIDVFTKDPKNITILIIGEGFIGTHIINELIEVGCKDMIRIYTRGDLSAEDWKSKGLKASSKISELFPNGLQPDIIILSIEYSNFTLICRRLLLNNLIHEATFIISCSFGFIRMKLCQALNTNNIFRVYVEPQDIIERFKHDTLSKLSTMLSTTHIYTEKVLISEAKMKLQQFYDSKLPYLEAAKNTNTSNNISIPPRIITADTLSRPSTAIARQFTPNRRGNNNNNNNNNSRSSRLRSSTSPDHDQFSRPSTGQLSSDQSSRPSSSKISPDLPGMTSNRVSMAISPSRESIINRSTLPPGQAQLFINTNTTTNTSNNSNNSNNSNASQDNSYKKNPTTTTTTTTTTAASMMMMTMNTPSNSINSRGTSKVTVTKVDKSISSSISLDRSIKSDGKDHLSLHAVDDDFSTSLASSLQQQQQQQQQQVNQVHDNDEHNNIDKNLRDEVMNDNDYVAASCLGARVLQVKGLIHQLENYYAIVRKLEHNEARKKALRNVVGFIEGQSSIVFDESDAISEHSASSNALSSGRMRPIDNDRSMENELIKIQMMETSLSNLTTKKRLKAQLKMKSKIDNALENLYDRGVFKYQDLLLFLLPKDIMYNLIREVFIKEEVIKTPKSRRRPITIPLYGKSMYNTDYIIDILKRDDEYEHLQGPAYSLMAYYDGKGDGMLEDIISLSSNESTISLIQPTEKLMISDNNHSNNNNNNNSKRNTMMGEVVTAVIDKMKTNVLNVRDDSCRSS